MIESVIIGGLHQNTLGVVRSLGETGQVSIKVLLVGKGIKKNNIISKSRYVKKVLLIM